MEFLKIKFEYNTGYDTKFVKSIAYRYMFISLYVNFFIFIFINQIYFYFCR